MNVQKGLTILTTAAVGLVCFTVGFSAGRQTLDQSPAKNAELVLQSYEERRGPELQNHRFTEREQIYSMVEQGSLRLVLVKLDDGGIADVRIGEAAPLAELADSVDQPPATVGTAVLQDGPTLYVGCTVQGEAFLSKVAIIEFSLDDATELPPGCFYKIEVCIADVMKMGTWVESFPIQAAQGPVTIRLYDEGRNPLCEKQVALPIV